MLTSLVMLSCFLHRQVKEAVLARKRLAQEEIRPERILYVLKKMCAFKVFRNTSPERHGVL